MRFALLLLALAIPLGVGAVDVSDAFDALQNETTEQPVIIVGGNPADVAAAQELQDEFSVASTTPVGADIDSPAIIVGGPCANPQWTDIAGDSCEDWAYDPGEAVIVAQDSSMGAVILVAGTTAEDTRAAVDYLVDNPNAIALDTDRVVINVENLPTPTGGVIIDTDDDDTIVNRTADDDNCLINPADDTMTVDPPRPGCDDDDIDQFDDNDEEDDNDEDGEDEDDNNQTNSTSPFD